MRAAVTLALCLLGADGLLGLDLSTRRQARASREDECKDSDAYKELLKAYCEMAKGCGGDAAKASEKYCVGPTTTTTTTTTEPPAEPVSVKPDPAGGDSESPKEMSKEIGAAGSKDAAPIYKPPMSESGKPSDAQGWDYNAHNEGGNHDGKHGGGKGGAGSDWSSNFAQCGSGNQSPIDLPPAVDIPGQTKGLLWFDYFASDEVSESTEMALVNAGHGLFARLDDYSFPFGDVKFFKDEYKVVDVQFHAPSEHTINGRHYALEAQILNKDKSGRLLAVAVMFEQNNTKSNAYLNALMKGAGGEFPAWSVSTAAQKVSISGANVNAFNLEKLLPYEDITGGRDLAFYNYKGSLTQPPCTADVDWWVLSNPMPASEDELKAIWHSIYNSPSMKHGNARATQAREGRKVSVGHVGFRHGGLGHRHIGQKRSDFKARQERGHNTLDHPWRPAAKAHWPKAANWNTTEGQFPATTWKSNSTAVVVGQYS